MIRSQDSWSQLVDSDPVLNKIDVTEHLGNQIPLDLSVTNSDGKRKFLRDFFYEGKPVVFTLAYYQCPMLCTFVLNGLVEAMDSIGWTAGKEYQCVTISIDHLETPELAKQKQTNYISKLRTKPEANGWQFCVASEPTIKKIADTLGFHYFYDSKQDEYAHPAVIFVLTDKGVISRYLYGLEYDKSQDLKLALFEAAAGKIGTIIDRVILYCYHYDPIGKKYTLLATRIMRLGGLLTMLGLGTFLASMWVKEKKYGTKRNI